MEALDPASRYGRVHFDLGRRSTSDDHRAPTNEDRGQHTGMVYRGVVCAYDSPHLIMGDPPASCSLYPTDPAKAHHKVIFVTLIILNNNIN